MDFALDEVFAGVAFAMDTGWQMFGKNSNICSIMAGLLSVGGCMVLLEQAFEFPQGLFEE